MYSTFFGPIVIHRFYSTINPYLCRKHGGQYLVSALDDSWITYLIRVCLIFRGILMSLWWTGSSPCSTLVLDRKYARAWCCGRLLMRLSNAQRQMAQQILTQLEDHPDAWTRVPDILERSTFPQSKVRWSFYAATSIFFANWHVSSTSACKFWRSWL